MWNVYDLVDQEGQTVYVGMSTNPKKRFWCHTKATPIYNNGFGKFYGRTDLSFEIISSHHTKKKALQMEGARKLSLGMRWTEREGPLAKKYNLRKLTQEQTEQIRHKYIPHKYTVNKLAKEYNVSEQAIKNILKNITYVKL